MEANEVEALESYIKTENEHWNGFAFKMLCQVIQGQFEKPETPLQLFSNSIQIFTEHHGHPLKAVNLFAGEIDRQNFNPNQKLFVYEWVCEYLRKSEFDFDLAPIKDLLKGQKEKLKTESQTSKPLTKNIRETLKEVIQKEFETLPETLKALEPEQRLNIICKLMPFVLPKVESVTHELGEPTEDGLNRLKW